MKRSPISEATRGVLTTLVALGLEAQIKSRDLPAIRRFYDDYRKGGLSGSERFVDMAYRISGVRYAIMTNIPFDSASVFCFFVVFFLAPLPCNSKISDCFCPCEDGISALETQEKGEKICWGSNILTKHLHSKWQQIYLRLSRNIPIR